MVIKGGKVWRPEGEWLEKRFEDPAKCWFGEMRERLQRKAHSEALAERGLAALRLRSG